MPFEALNELKAKESAELAGVYDPHLGSEIESWYSMEFGSFKSVQLTALGTGRRLFENGWRGTSTRIASPQAPPVIRAALLCDSLCISLISMVLPCYCIKYLIFTYPKNPVYPRAEIRVE